MLNGNVYAVQGNWAMEKGLMKLGTQGCINDAIRPAQEVGCMCRLQWIYNLRNLPSEMVTEKGRSELERVRTIVENSPELSKQKLASVTDSESSQSRKKGWLARWLG